ncbi:MAG: hypothetical protein WBX05_19985 [Pseudolabrys sp.]|jgi:hypothetical protein
MGVKNVTLYSLPYVVGVASILAVAQQLAPPITSLDVSHTTTIKQTISGQTVNRALKQDCLPIHRAIFTRPSEIKLRSTEPSTVRQIVVEPATG